MAAMNGSRVLIAYDGSASSATAVGAAAILFRTAHAYVATVPRESRMHTGTALPVLPAVSPNADQEAIDALVSPAGAARSRVSCWSRRPLHHSDVSLLVVPGGGALDGPVGIAYYGSEGAKHAVEAVGRLMSGHATVVVHARELAQSPAAWALAAGTTTRDGVATARAAGLDAVRDTVESTDGTWRAGQLTAMTDAPWVCAAAATPDTADCR